MKIATYSSSGSHYVGRVDDDGLHVHPFDLLPAEAQRGALPLIERVARGEPLPGTGAPVALSTVDLLAPIPRPRRNVFCVGKNYHEHAREFAGSGFDTSSASAKDAVPTDPIIFTKVPECVIGPNAPIRMPVGVSEAIDYEAELAVVIGRGGRGIKAADAMSHVWGWTIVNDVTARDWQHRHKQWDMGKSFDTFCPMGPWLVSADECDGTDTAIRCFVNGERRQDARTSDLIFDVPKLIETISAGITLYPGDLIATGTPVGVGIGFNPPKYLRAGDTLRV